MQSITRAILLVASAAALFTSGASATAIAEPLPKSHPHHVRGLQTYTASDNYQATMLAAVNAERAKQGLAAFCTNKKLQAAAQLHSEDQAKNNFMSHTGSNGSSMSDRITAQSFKWNGIAENVAAGQVDVAAVMKSWMSSDGHRANIMGNYKFFGTGYAYNAKATYKHYWTQDFGVGSKEVCDSAGTVAPAPTPAATTGSPVQQTSAPITPAPTTPAPTTPAPTTVVPVTPAPTSPVQQTSAPETPAPTTPAPTTAPVTLKPTTATPSTGLTMQAAMLAAVNAERAKQGLAAFCTNKKLQAAAQLHSEDQAKNNFMSHTGSNGSSMSDRITAQSFKWNGIAENVAAGQVDVAAVMKSWMSSDGHRANIMGNYKFFGTGYAYNAKATYKHYWTQDFGVGSSEVCE